MIKITIYSFKKSIRLKKISNILGKHKTSKNFEELFKNMDKYEKALEELLDLCESDIYLINTMRKYNANRETLKRAYRKLLKMGCGQWKRGHYIPASSLIYSQTLDYLLKNIDKEGDDFVRVGWRLLKYFEYGEIGKIEE